ncbi:MAG: polysaccharide deacetylase family protein [Kiritimatiellia bacterium]
MQIALRIDVDTLRGTRLGVPSICRVLARHGWQASFFFSVGPDNMGRHLWRLVRPAFLLKMLRSNAPALYGWDILLRGVFWPGPLIGPRCAPVIRAAAADGHEIGLHAWDHQAWQARAQRMSVDDFREHLRKGHLLLSDILGRAPTASAAPGWRCTDAALLAKDEFGYAYNSDCRGRSVFLPRVGNRVLRTPQVPVDLPTYDEVIGCNGVMAENYNQRLLAGLREGGMNVLTIHAEVEGIAAAPLFAQFAEMIAERGWRCVPLGALVNPAVPEDGISRGQVAGRDGWVAVQGCVLRTATPG